MTSSNLSVPAPNDTSTEIPHLQIEVHSYLLQWITCAFGIAGNFLVLLIYSKKKPKAPSERFIIVIATMDFAMNLGLLIFTVARFFLPPALFLPSCLLSNSFFDLINTASSLLVCWMTVNRYVAVCRPHSYSDYFTVLNVNLILLFTFLLSLASCSLSFAICLTHFPPEGWEIETVEDDSLDMTKLIWVNIRLLLLIVASVLMAVLYRKVAITLREKRTKNSARMELKKPSMRTGHEQKHQCREDQVTSANGVETIELMAAQNSPNKTCTEVIEQYQLEKKRTSLFAENNVIVEMTSINTNATAASPRSARAGCSSAVAPEHEADNKNSPVKERPAHANAHENNHNQNNSSAFGRARGSVCKILTTSGNRSSQRSTRSASVDQNLTMTLFAISVTYVLLMLPDVIVHWLDAINVFTDMNKFEDYRIPAQFLYGLSFVMNPVIYFFCNHYFKTQLKELLNKLFPNCFDLSSASTC